MLFHYYIHVLPAARLSTMLSDTSNKTAKSKTGGGEGGSFGAVGSVVNTDVLRFFIFFEIALSGSIPESAFSNSFAWFKFTGNPSKTHPDSAGRRLEKRVLSEYTVFLVNIHHIKSVKHYSVRTTIISEHKVSNNNLLSSWVNSKSQLWEENGIVCQTDFTKLYKALTCKLFSEHISSLMDRAQYLEYLKRELSLKAQGVKWFK